MGSNIGIGLGAFTQGFMGGARFVEDVNDRKERREREKVESEQRRAAGQLAIDTAKANFEEVKRDREYREGMRSAARGDTPTVAPSGSAIAASGDSGTAASDYGRANAILTSATTPEASVPERDDPDSRIREGMRRQMGYALSQGRVDDAQKMFEAMHAYNERRLGETMQAADRQFALNQDPSVYIDAYNKHYPDGMRIESHQRRPDGGFTLTVKNDRNGQTFTRDVSKDDMPKFIMGLRDPAGLRKAEYETFKDYQKAQFDLAKNIAIENVKGNFKLLEEQIKAGRLTPEQQRHDQEVLAARLRLSQIGVKDHMDPRLQETLPGGIRNDKYNPLIAGWAKKAGEALHIEQVDQSLVQGSRTGTFPQPPAPGQAPGGGAPAISPTPPAAQTAGAQPPSSPQNRGAAAPPTPERIAQLKAKPIPQGAPQGAAWAIDRQGREVVVYKDERGAVQVWNAPAVQPAGQRAAAPAAGGSEEAMTREQRQKQARAIPQEGEGEKKAAKPKREQPESMARKGMGADAPLGGITAAIKEKVGGAISRANERATLGILQDEGMPPEERKFLAEKVLASPEGYSEPVIEAARAVTGSAQAAPAAPAGDKAAASGRAVESQAVSIKAKLADGKALTPQELAMARALEKKSPGTFNALEKRAIAAR